METDPLSSVFHFFLSMALLCDGQIDAAVAEGRRHQELGFPVGSGPFAFTLMEAGRVDEAVEYLQGTRWESYLRVAEALQDGISEQNRFVTSSPLNEVWALALLGNQEAAITRMGAIIRAGPPMPLRGIWRPSIERLLGDDPRYQALLEQAGITW